MDRMEENKRYLLIEKGKITVGDMKEIVSFDEKEVVLRCSDSLLTVRGSGFGLEATDVKTGTFSMKGKINSLVYHDRGEKTSFLKKLFK